MSTSTLKKIVSITTARPEDGAGLDADNRHHRHECVADHVSRYDDAFSEST
jgi:hypothetical protein